MGLLLGWHASGWQWRESGKSAVAPPAVAGAVLPMLGQSGGGSQSASLRKLIEQVNYPEKYPDFHQQFSPAQFETYLERHQRNASSLLAVYRITKDEALLREAYERFPEDPQVALLVLTSLSLPLEDKLVMLEKVRHAHPGDPLGDFMTSVALAKEGKTAEAVPFFQAGLAKPRWDFSQKEQRLNLREALMSAGLPSTEARMLGFTLTWPGATGIFINVSNQGKREIEGLLQEGREDEAFTLAGQMLALSRRLEEYPQRTTTHEILAQNFKRGALYALPNDVEIGDTGQTVQAVKEREKTRITDSYTLTNAYLWHMQHFDDAGVELFYQIVEERGERAALQWADAYHGPAPAPRK